MTGLDEHSKGFLSLSVNNIPQTEPHTRFSNGQTVIDRCFSSLDSISVSNSKWNAWSGKIMVKKNRISKKLVCINCSGGIFKGTIAVDGNDDGLKMAPTWCLNGNLCTLELAGKNLFFDIKSNLDNVLKFLILTLSIQNFLFMTIRIA